MSQPQQTVTLDEAFRLGEQHRAAGRLQEAAQIFEQILRANPNHFQAMFCLAECALKGGNIPAAIELYTRSGNLQPLWPPPRTRLGFALLEEQRIGEAEAAFRAAINIDPTFPDAHYGLAWVRLLQGDFATGWEEMEWRLKCRAFAAKAKQFPQPQWKGEDLNGKTILLFQEQGHGDVIQYARYASIVADRGGRVILGCTPSLARILKSIRGVAEIAPDPTKLPPFDYQLTLYSVPYVLRTTLETIPNQVPYIHPDEELVRKWSARVDRKSKQLHVGLCWTGNPKHENDALRSLPPELLAFFAGAPNVKFYSLQKDVDLMHARRLPASPALIDWAVDLHDFADTAAAISALDLVISVDTSVAHLAGALGKPVWTLLPFHADWRWLLQREDSPWYPTMRLFRQQTRGDWTGALLQVTQALREKFESQTMTPDPVLLGRFIGSYFVSGKTPEGAAYHGTMALARKGAFLHAEAKLDTGVRYGLAMPWGGRLAMAFGAKDKVEIGAYRIEGKNVVGMWIPPGATDDDFARCGREVSVIESPGVFKITKAHAVDQSAYTGTVKLDPAPPTGADSGAQAVKMTWSLHDGEYHSFGIAYADAVYSTFNLARGEGHGIAVYTVAGDVLNGCWLNEKSMKLGEEMLRR